MCIRDSYTTERNFFLNGFGNSQNTLIRATYRYIIPRSKESGFPQYEPTGQSKSLVRDILNLDDINEIMIEFKRIPRKLKGIDNRYDLYVPNDQGQLTKSIVPSPGGPIDATLKMWRCINAKTGNYAKTPRYYQWLNAMIYRAYFGSEDGAEFKGKNRVTSKDETDWIPYDYE